MQKIIPLISLFGIFIYLLNLPAPMDKVANAVENREFYQLRLMDEARQPISAPLIPTVKKSTELTRLVAHNNAQSAASYFYQLTDNSIANHSDVK